MKIKDKDLAARIGKIKTRKGVIETPYLFPVIDPYRQEVSIEDIKKAGFNAVITNAYLAYKKGWRKDIRELIGDKEITVMTDSGAYQLLEYGEIDATNREIIEAQKILDSDIAVILDVPTGDTGDRDKALHTVKETLSRGLEAIRIIDDKRLWVLPIQGGVHLDLLEYSVKESVKMNYDIYALGSPTRFMEKYRYDVIIDMIQIVREHLPPEKPLHLFGAGHAMMIPFAVAMGVDLFDSASYILFARDDRYMLEEGTVKLDRLEYFPCSCPVCSKYTPRDLRDMSPRERTRLLAIHNLHVIRRVLNKTKQYILEGRLWEFLEQQSRMHPSLKDSFYKIMEKTPWLERYSPRYKPVSKALKLYSRESRENPIVKRAIEYVEKHYKPPTNLEILHIKPYKQELETPEDKEHIVYYTPIVGLIPYDLKLAQPFSRVSFPRKIGREEINHVAQSILGYVGQHGEIYKKIRITICEDHSVLADMVKKALDREAPIIRIVKCES